MEVGQLVPRGHPPPSFVERIERILADRPAITRLAEATADPRLDPAHWQAMLTLDLNLLARWAARRMLSIPPGGPDIDRVLSLLPGYGFALHMLRRAAPFAALGIPTFVSVRADLRDTASRCFDHLARALALDQTLLVADAEPATWVAGFAASGDPIVLTGRRETLDRLRGLHPDARIVAATGGCLVVTGTDRRTLEDTRRALEHRRREPSCSNLGFAVLSPSLSPGSPIEWLSEAGSETAYPSIGALLMDAHPTLILDTGAAARRPATVAGYRVVGSDRDGIPETLDGVARDPVGGWPGDYLV